MTTTTEQTCGTLMDYQTGEAIRPATEAERTESREAAERDNGAGAFRVEVDGRQVTCYVEE